MDPSIQAIVKKVEKIGGELVWVRGVAIGMFAMLGLIVTQLFIMQNSISSIGTDLSIFKVDVHYKISAVEGRLTDLDSRLTDLDSRLTDLDSRLTDLDSRLTDIETDFSGFKDGQQKIVATLEKMGQRLEALEHQSRQR